MEMLLPYAVGNGVYELCKPDRYFTDYLLFAVNPADKFVTPPGIYAALTPVGIEFTIWTRNGRYTVRDVTSDVEADSLFAVAFAWDWSSSALGAGARMAIFVNGVSTAAGNFPLTSGDLSGVEFTALDTAAMDFGTTCTVCDFVTFSEVPEGLRHRVSELTGRYLGRDFVAACGRDDVYVWNDGAEVDPLVVLEMGCLGESQRSIAVCDTSHDIYVASYLDDGRDSGAVSLFSASEGRVTRRMTGLSNPRAVAVTQVDGVGYPTIFTQVPRECPYVWIADEGSVIIADHDLNALHVVTGFDAPECIVPLSDGRAWVCDPATKRIVLLTEDGEILVDAEQAEEPVLGAATVENEFFYYAEDSATIRKITFADTLEASVGVGPGLVGFDVNPNSGIVMAAFEDGRVRTYSRNLTFWSEFTIAPALSGAFVKRGYEQASFYCIDALSSKIYRVSLTTGVVEDEIEIEDLLSNGTLAGPAYSTSLIEAEFDISGDVNAGFEAIYGLEAPQFKVDELEADLTGGRENEAEDRRSGLRRGDSPTDLRPGAVKTGRLPE
jgi:hypothetical protein